MNKIKEIFNPSDNSASSQFVRYVIVGGIAYVFDFGFLYIFTDTLQIHYLVSATLSFLIGVVVNYTLARIFVFKTYKVKSQKIEVVSVVIISLSGLLLNNLIIWVLVNFLFLYYLLSKLLAAIVVLMWNYICRRILYVKLNASSK